MITKPMNKIWRNGERNMISANLKKSRRDLNLKKVKMMRMKQSLRNRKEIERRRVLQRSNRRGKVKKRRNRRRKSIRRSKKRKRTKTRKERARTKNDFLIKPSSLL